MKDAGRMNTGTDSSVKNIKNQCSRKMFESRVWWKPVESGAELEISFERRTTAANKNFENVARSWKRIPIT